jgi:hypothetical protein
MRNTVNAFKPYSKKPRGSGTLAPPCKYIEVGPSINKIPGESLYRKQ